MATLLPALLAAQADTAVLLGRWYDPALQGSAAYNNTYNEVWGLAVNGREYGVIGSTFGTHLIDITDPTAPFEAFRIPGAAKGQMIVHRDFKDYAGYLYAVCDEGASTLQVIDISQLPDTVTVAYDSKTLLSRSHNIYIDSSRARLYTLATGGGDATYSAMRVYDLADPELPVFLGAYNTFGDIVASHVHDAFVRNDTAYLHCGNDGFAVMDFSDPKAPEPLGTLPFYPAKGYNHSGWLSGDGKHYYMADENHGEPLKAIDVQDPANMQVVALFAADPADKLSIPHNIHVRGELVYVSYYYDGLQVFDVSDPTSPEKVLVYPTSKAPKVGSYEGAWGVYPHLPSGNILVSDMQEGLFILAPPSPVSASRPIGKSPELRIWPNPARGTVHLEGMPAGTELVRLHGPDGRMRAEWTVDGVPDRMALQLPADLPGGIWFLEVRGRHGMEHFTLVTTHAE